MKKFLFVLCLFVAGPAFADESESLLKDISWTLKSGSRISAGYTPYDGSATNFAASFARDNWDLSVWTALENENDFTLNEADIGIGYNIPVGNALNVRVGLGAWIFPKGTEHYVLDVDVSYSGFIDMVLNIDHSFTDSGTAYTVTFSKNLPLGNLWGGSFSFVPSIGAVCLDDFFALKGCPSNVIYQGLVTGSWDNKWSADLFYNDHDGGETGVEPFEDAQTFGFTLRRSF
jgi:hypothetical protein